MQPVDTAPLPDTPRANAGADTYAAEERDAVQWVASLTPEEAATVVQDAIEDWQRIVGADSAETLQGVDLGTCDDCRVPLTGTLTFDGYLHRECPQCGKPYRCVATSQVQRKSSATTVATAPDIDGWPPVDTIDPNEVPPCPACGKQEAWESLAGTWRCLHCDPPRVAQRLRRQRDVILRREARQRMRNQHTQEEPEVLNGVG